jgi:hypothetical protein
VVYAETRNSSKVSGLAIGLSFADGSTKSQRPILNIKLLQPTSMICNAYIVSYIQCKTAIGSTFYEAFVKAIKHEAIRAMAEEFVDLCVSKLIGVVFVLNSIAFFNISTLDQRNLSTGNFDKLWRDRFVTRGFCNSLGSITTLDD